MALWLKLTLAIVAGLVLVFAAVTAYASYRLRNLPDSRNLQRQVDTAVTDALRDADLGTVAVAVYRDGRVYIRRYGANAGAPDDIVLFEIGSITKVFTVLAAQRLVGQGTLRWSDPIWPLLPPEQRPAVDDGTTLEMLATHTSGLPRLPESWFPRLDATSDPYAALRPTDVFAAYASGEGRVPWSRATPDYSNLGLGLLGHLLERHTGESYAALTRRLLLAPLGLNHTTIALDSVTRQQLAPGRDESGAPAPPWTFSALAGAGAYRATIEDMAAFLQAAVEQTPVPDLDWNATWTPRRSATGDEVALGWQLDRLAARVVGLDRVIWHNGGTGGYSSWMGLHPERRIGVVVLAARSASEAVDELGATMLLMSSHISFAPGP